MKGRVIVFLRVVMWYNGDILSFLKILYIFIFNKKKVFVWLLY